MAVNDRLVLGATAAPGGLIPSENFGVALYEGDGSTPRVVNGGKFGAAAYFNGTTSIIETSGLDNSGGQFNNGITISAWVFLTNYTIDTHPIVRSKNTSTQAGISLTVSNTGVAEWQITNTSNVDRLVSTTQLSNNTWYHLVGVREPGATTNAVKLYINGSLDAQINGTITIASIGTFTNQLAIGNRSSSSDNVNQKIDQVLIFSKPLSASEVTTLYNQTLATSTSLNPLNDSTVNTFDVFGDGSCLATYQFENNELDLGGNYDGTGTDIQYAVGRYGQAASFNGTTSQVTTSNMTGLDSTTISLSAWVYFDAVGVSNAILSRFGTGGHSTYQILLRTTASNVWSFATYDGTGSGDSLLSTATVTTGTWYHVVVVADGTSKKIYVNGSEVASSTVAFSVNTSSGVGLNIGGRDDLAASSTTRMNGRIDQVRTFNKAISASEVASLYNENSLLALYRFEGNANDDTRNYDGSASNVSYEYGLNFTPDFVWLKNRSSSTLSFRVVDSTRGATNHLSSNLSLAEVNSSTNVLSFDTGGFSVGSSQTTNKVGDDLVAWCLKANGGTTSSNTDGTITSTVQANTDAGFSIVKHTNSGSKSSTVGHGLGVAPKILITKKYTINSSWWVYTTLIDGSLDYIQLNGTGSKNNSSGLGSPTSTVFYNESGTNDGAEYITYAFAEVNGFSKFGTYTGNGSTNGPIVETGFELAFLMIKRTDTAGYNWQVWDNKRTPAGERVLYPNLTNAESSYGYINFLSNGFQHTRTNAGINANGGTYLYMAFAADPDTEAPTVAKSFTTVTYDGTGVDGLAVTGLGFKPGMVWIKNRDLVRDHNLADIVQGVSKEITPNTNEAQESRSITSFDSDGFTLDNASGNYNASGSNYVAWAWKADDNEPTINTEGSIDSLVSANANAGFSIVKYEGNGSAGATIGHGLSAAPEMVIIKNLDSAVDWRVGHTSAGWTKFGKLNTTDAFSTSSVAWNDTAPSSTVVTLGTSSGLNSSGVNYIAYCFHSVSGFSNIGSYTGTGNTNTQSINLGFQADWVMIKDYNVGGSWWIIDSVRGDSKEVKANSSDAQTSNSYVTFTSTGFDVTGGLNSNSVGSKFIYAAFKIN